MIIPETLLSKLTEQQVVYLATVDGDQPKVRPVTLIYKDNRFYVITGARGGVNANKLAQIHENPKVEYYLTLKGEDGDGFIRGEASASIVDNQNTRTMIYNAIGWAKNFFPTVDHPDYVLLELRHHALSYRYPGEYEIQNIP
jgi:uncharacterized pyridoxamine 5'-phosphate oxidase family protein